MKFVFGGINGNYLDNYLAAPGDIELVEAAVAYASSDKLFEWCWANRIPLRFWGRFDESVPVSPHLLDKFLARRSANFVCHLVRHYHPKVIWWHGLGVYIGSANLTERAWANNVEAGVFLTDEELSAQGAAQLQEFFEEISRHAAPLSDELVELLKKRNALLSKREAEGRGDRTKFLSTGLVPEWPGLSRISRLSASTRRRDSFLNEWNSTLQIVRDIAAKVSRPESRPSWVAETTPVGAQADQFLHAHYYQRTFDGQKAAYERHFEDNRRDPDAARDEAIVWWAGLKSAPRDEDRTLNVVAPRLRYLLSSEVLPTLTERQLVELLGGVHASIEYARRVSNDLVGLPPGSYTIPQKIEAMAKHLTATGSRRTRVLQTLSYVLYGGAPADVAMRLWEAANEPEHKVEMLGISALGEIVGWAMPETFPPRNGRTSKALRSLGYDVRVHSGA